MPNNLIVGNDGSNTLDGTAGDDLIYGFNPDGPQGQVNSIAATRVATGLTQPLFAAAPPGDPTGCSSSRRPGRSRSSISTRSRFCATPFLDVSTQIVDRRRAGPARPRVRSGLRPERLFLRQPDQHQRRHGDPPLPGLRPIPNMADAGERARSSSRSTSRTPANHKAGWLGFGPDGYLYAALGDGGGGGDPFNNGAEPRTACSARCCGSTSMRTHFPATHSQLRHPGRQSVRRRDGSRRDLGAGPAQSLAAELRPRARRPLHRRRRPGRLGGDRPRPVRAPTTAGTTTRARTHSRAATPLTGGTLTFPDPFLRPQRRPVDHRRLRLSRRRARACTATISSPTSSPRKVFTLRFNGTAWVATDRTAQITPTPARSTIPSSFGEDGRGNLYVVDFDGEVFRLTPNVTSADQGDTLNGLGGNDMLFGGSGNDTLDGGGDDDTVYGGPGDDMLLPGSGHDLLFGDAATIRWAAGPTAAMTPMTAVQATTPSRWCRKRHPERRHRPDRLNGGAGGIG